MIGVFLDLSKAFDTIIMIYLQTNFIFKEYEVWPWSGSEVT